MERPDENVGIIELPPVCRHGEKGQIQAQTRLSSYCYDCHQTILRGPRVSQILTAIPLGLADFIEQHDKPDGQKKWFTVVK